MFNTVSSTNRVSVVDAIPKIKCDQEAEVLILLRVHGGVALPRQLFGPHDDRSGTCGGGCKSVGPVPGRPLRQKQQSQGGLVFPKEFAKKLSRSHVDSSQSLIKHYIKFVVGF